MNNAFEITSKLKRDPDTIVDEIQQFPDKFFVARCSNGSWAKISYSDTGLGLACFLSHHDSKSWFSVPKKDALQLVEMTRAEASVIAKTENLRYLHLLSESIKQPLGHLKV